MSGETPDVLEDYLEPAADGSEVVTREAAAGASARSDSEDGLKIRLWDPSQQLRYRAKRSVPPRPDGAPNRSPRRLAAR
jgi:biotin synthase